MKKMKYCRIMMIVDAYIPLENLEALQRLSKSQNLRLVPQEIVSIPVEGDLMVATVMKQ